VFGLFCIILIGILYFVVLQLLMLQKKNTTPVEKSYKFDFIGLRVLSHQCIPL